jgi:hypothetical protein
MVIDWRTAVPLHISSGTVRMGGSLVSAQEGDESLAVRVERWFVSELHHPIEYYAVQYV